MQNNLTPGKSKVKKNMVFGVEPMLPDYPIASEEDAVSGMDKAAATEKLSVDQPEAVVKAVPAVKTVPVDNTAQKPHSQEQSARNGQTPAPVSAQRSPERQTFISSLTTLEKIEDYLASPGAHLSMDELKQLKLWLCWRFEDKVDKTTGEVKPTKVPCDAKGKIGATRGYFKRWMTYEKAASVAKECGYEGVGFVILRGLCFVDIDHHAPSDPFAAERLERFSATYAELSQSGNGIHIYGLCGFSRIPSDNGKWPEKYYKKNSRLGIEVYVGGFTDRYAVCTLNSLNDCEFTDCTDAMLKTLDVDMVRATVENGSSLPEVHRDWDLEELIGKMSAAKNGEKFKKLFDKGDISDYGSASEADAALAAIIAFWVGNDPETIMQLIEKSALNDSKWQRQDYQKSTIAAGIRACNGVFHKDVMPKKRPPFIYIDEKGREKVNAPLLAEYVKEHIDYCLIRENERSDTLLYVYTNGVYKFHTEKMFNGIIKQFIYDYKLPLASMRVINEARNLLLAEAETMDHKVFNNDENVINFQNGLLSLNDMKIRPHTPELLSTIQIPCDRPTVPMATPIFDNYISTLTGNDIGVQNLILEFMGAVISNIKGWRMKKALFFVGLGDTGKSVLRQLMVRFLGSNNCSSIDLAQLEGRFGTSAIYLRRLAGSADMSFMTVSELSIFKSCVGGDEIFVEFKGKDGFQATYDGLMWFCMNRLPKFGGDNGPWVYDRVMVVRCDNRIAEADKDKTLLDKLYAERQGIIQKAVYALLNVIKNGYRFSETESVRYEREEYAAANNSIVAFWNECMVNEPPKTNSVHTVKKIYGYYTSWCREMHDGYEKTYPQFQEELAAYLEVPKYNDLKKRGANGELFKSWRLRDDIEQKLDSNDVFHNFMSAVNAANAVGECA